MRKKQPGRRSRSILFVTAALAAFMLVPALPAVAAEVPHVKVNMAGTGSGVVTSGGNGEEGENPGTPPIECSYNGTVGSGTCENEPNEGDFPGFYSEVLVADPAPASGFTGWTVQKGSAEGCPAFGEKDKCFLFNPNEFEKIEFEVTATFTLLPFELTLFVNGAGGSGTVTSAPAGLNCAAGQECSADLDGIVTLTAKPAPGYMVGGWIGCKQASATTCTVMPNTADEEREAAAIFVKEGSQGGKGNDGSNGPVGSQGPQGPAGPKGPAGKVSVSCKVKGSKKVTCTVKQPKASASQRLRWSLRREGHTVSHGNTSAATLQRVLNDLRPGRYSLRVAGQPRNLAIEIS